MNFEKSCRLKRKFNEIIPGGSHTYAKGDDQFPEFQAPYIVKGDGCHIWDVDGNEFIEYGMGLRSVTLGHAYPSVVEAVCRQVREGSNFGRPAPIELEAAESLLGLIEGAEMVKFAKNGSDVTSAAIKLARAYTGRDMIAICGDHPFFSVDDWFIGSTPVNAGVPEKIRELTVKFRYNDLQSAKDLLETYPNRIACFILEPEKNIPPENNFLSELKNLCHQHGAVLVFDEIITGFRWHLQGAQKLYGVAPDLSTFGKALGNGFSISALAGKREIMERGGLYHNHDRVFLLSTTYGAEYHSLAAAIEVMNVYKNNGVIEHLYAQGKKLRDGINQAVSELNLENYFEVLGDKTCCLVYNTKDQEQKSSQDFRTLFLQETLKRGLLMPSLIVSYSHSDRDINYTAENIYEALKVYKNALRDGVDKYLEGKPIKPVYRRLN